MLVIAIIATLISVGALFLAYRFLAKRGGGSSGQLAELSSQVHKLDEQLKEVLKAGSTFASKAQFDTVVELRETAKSSLDGEKQKLKGIEQRLEGAQRDVEGREAHQQEMKTAREEDDLKLQQLMESYGQVSNESIELEQKLAASLKNLDSIVGELELSSEAKAVLEELSNALTSLGALLRDLITEHQSTNKRLQALQAQHMDLEEEYTRLVEQQLGE